jgi:hypothetical protein
MKTDISRNYEHFQERKCRKFRNENLIEKNNELLNFVFKKKIVLNFGSCSKQGNPKKKPSKMWSLGYASNFRS